jgi:hypothetical protein
VRRQRVSGHHPKESWPPDHRPHAKAGEDGGVDGEPEGSADKLGSLRNLCKLGVERFKLSFDEGEVGAGLIGLAEC